MNPIEIEQAVTALADAPFDASEFPYMFLEAFGNKETTIKKLKSGTTNASDVENGVLQRNNIHIATAPAGDVDKAFKVLRESPKTASAKAKFILATDGETFAAEELASGQVKSGTFNQLSDSFGFFLSLAGIAAVQEIRNNPFDIKATSRLNRLYIELLKENPEWGTEEKRHDLNRFMTRLIFCFFAEDTGIFRNNLFTATVDQMTDKSRENAHEIIAALFRTMDIKPDERKAAILPRWADAFPYVNGSLFAGANEVPHFSKIARSYLMRVGELDWKEINPDIFGSMIQAVADEDERADLGMHYTSVPNILKVLNPLFLDELNEQLEKAGDNRRKLMNLRRRLSRIRVFDPACGSGNFLVIAYIKLREIEFQICNRLNVDEEGRQSRIKLSNLYGLEIKDFAVEVARLSLLIAEYQCDVRFINQKTAYQLMLPLRETGKIKRANALQEDWLAFCPPVKPYEKDREDLFDVTAEEAELDEEAGETYICGNPPYMGSTWQSAEQKADMKAIFNKRAKNWKSLDYVAGWFMKAADYAQVTETTSAFVSTNSICQGQQVPILWPVIFAADREIAFACTSFKWSNLASHKAGVTVIIVGLAQKGKKAPVLFENDQDGSPIVRQASHINAYLVPDIDIIVKKKTKPFNELALMVFGNKSVDGGNLHLTGQELDELNLPGEVKDKIIKKFVGSEEFIRGKEKYCLWILDEMLAEAEENKEIKRRIDAVYTVRIDSRDIGANKMADSSHQFREMNIAQQHSIVVPRVSSENRPYLPVGLVGNDVVIGDSNFALYDAPLWNMALIASRLHLVWIATVCGKLETRYRYSNTLGWNTFPVPTLTEKNKADLTRAAENILLAREAHFPATIADLYVPDAMPEDLRAAHERNDEILERIYIGRRFKNDTERLEKLFGFYTKMTTKKGMA